MASINPAEFILTPHPTTAATAVRTLSAHLIHAPDGSLAVRYTLRGDITRLRLPAHRATPHFCDKLWEHTCFELFMGRRGNPAYREYNFSPSGDWAAFTFADYRRPQEPQDGAPLPAPEIVARQTVGRLELDIRLPPEAIPAGEGGLELALTAVIEASDIVDGSHSYWALTHSGEKPDFHLRSSFSLLSLS